MDSMLQQKTQGIRMDKKKTRPIDTLLTQDGL